MEKNVAAFVRTDTFTIKVRYVNQGATNHTEYTYVSTIPLEVGDMVVVPSQQAFSVARVLKVDEDVNLEPNSDIRFSFVVCKVPFEQYERTMEINREIEETINTSYKARVRDSFRNQILCGMDEDTINKLKRLGAA